MKHSADNIVQVNLNIKPLERVLIVTDTKMLKFGKMIYDSSRKINLETTLMVMEPRSRPGEEPPDSVAQAMKFSDVVIAPTFHSITHTKAVGDAIKSGARVATMPGVDKFSFEKGGLTADYYQVKEMTMKMFSKVKNSKSVHVTSRSGTEISFSVEGREWIADTGILTEWQEYPMNLPAGEVFVAPLEGTAYGKIVFDHFELAKGKSELIVENGAVKETKNCEKLEEVFKNLGDKSREIAEFGIGTNPKSKVIGNLLEDEKSLKTCHIALGNNAHFGGTNDVEFHLDGIIEKPNVRIDRNIIIKEGKWLI